MTLKKLSTSIGSPNRSHFTGDFEMMLYPSRRIGFVIAAVLASCATWHSPSIAADPVLVELDTTAGKIKLALDKEKAPITVDNFVKYVKSGHYDGTIFHRVIEDFMIQGGGMTPDMEEKETRDPIKNESANNLLNKKMTVAMARTPEPDSATSQFFINLADNDFLNRAQSRDGHGYAVFGKVAEGEDVVEKIGKMPTRPRGVHGNVPVEDVVIKSARVVEK